MDKKLFGWNVKVSEDLTMNVEQMAILKCLEDHLKDTISGMTEEGAIKDLPATDEEVKDLITQVMDCFVLKNLQYKMLTRNVANNGNSYEVVE